MSVNNKTIFITLFGLLSASTFMPGCALVETPEDAEALEVPGQVVRGEVPEPNAEIVIPATSMSGYGKVKLKEEGKVTVDEFKKSHGQELEAAYKVLVVGHSDTSGRASYNKVLSRKRAQCVADYLILTGVDADKIRVIGRSSREPVASNETSEGRVQNRRVEILVIAEKALDRILFPGDVLFERNSADLTGEGRAFLEEKRVEARDLLNSATYVEIIGHTDSVGDNNDNLSLSKSRAVTVRDYLVGQGLDGSKVFTAGMGGTVPIASNDTEEGRVMNSRVQILMLDRTKELP